MLKIVTTFIKTNPVNIIKYAYLFYKINTTYVDKYKNRLKKILKITLSIISFFSLTIITGLVIFFIGRFGINDLCDDDLIMQGIKGQLPDNLEIVELCREDLHGFGNESLIVFAIDRDESEVANKLLIYDKINNSVLNKINNLFGYGSNYKLNYSFSLVDPSFEDILPGYYSLEIIDMVDLTGDLSKEIIVKFIPYPCGNFVMHQIGIFGYSYETHKYRLIGTYPPMKLYDNNGIDIVSTVFHQGDYDQSNYYDNNEKFQLEYGNKFHNDFFIDDKYYGTVLVRTSAIINWGDEATYDPHKYNISVFQAKYDSDNDELKWRVLFSKLTDEHIDGCTQEYVKEYLENSSLIWNIELR